MKIKTKIMARILVVVFAILTFIQRGTCSGEHNALDLTKFGTHVVGPGINYSHMNITDRLTQSLFESNITYLNTYSILRTGLSRLGAGTACYTDIAYVLSGLTNIYSPLFKYIDAAAKIPHGIMQGKLNWVGDYQECYSIQKLVNPITSTAFNPNYFTGILNINNQGILAGQPISMGMCLPDSCSATEATNFINYELNLLKVNYTFIPENLTVFMIKDDAKEMDSGGVAMIIVSGFLLSLVVLGTFVDVVLGHCDKLKEPVTMENKMYDDPHSDRTGLLAGDIFADDLGPRQSIFKRSQNLLLDIFLGFSFLRNSAKLVNTDTAHGPLACLNGLRVLSMWWVILGHTYAFCIYVLDNIVEAADIVKRFSFQPILNGTFSVDSFFFLSGLLVAYLAMKQFLEQQTFNWIYYFLHRYWRLTPLYAFVIFFFAYLYIYLLQGPFRSTLDPGFEQGFDVCKKYWWSNLLYINNFYPEYGSLTKTCLGWSWYLANDMQFFWFISPIMLVLFMYTRKYLPSNRNMLPGIAGGVFFILSCIIIRASLVSYYGLYGLQATPTKHTEEPMGKNGPLYGRPYARMSVYVVGMLTGFVLAESKNRIRIPKLVALIGWCVAIATALAVVYGQYYYNHHTDLLNPTNNPHMTLTQSIFYVSLSRTLWGLCLAWLVLACVSGNGGWVTQILSWKIWAPLGRLTYAAYLIHPMVLFCYYLNRLQPVHFSDWEMVNIFLSSLVITYGLSFFISMCLEGPLLHIEKAILKRRQGRSVN